MNDLADGYQLLLDAMARGLEQQPTPPKSASALTGGLGGAAPVDFTRSGGDAFFLKVVAGDFSREVCDRLQRGFAAYLEVDTSESLSLATCLRLPGPARIRKLRRDRWIVVLSQLVPENTRWAQAMEVSRQLSDFVSRGPWLAWCELDDPPPGTSALRTALFYTARNNAGASISAKQIDRILGQIS